MLYSKLWVWNSQLGRRQMKNLGEIIIRDRALKNESDAIVVQYIYSLIRNKELSRITLNKSFRDAKKELENAHIEIDAMICDESVIRQVLKSKAEKYIADRKNVILLREKCKNLPSLSEINSLDFTDRVHLILQAHRYYKYVQLDEMLFEEENIVIYLDTWIEQFWNGTVNLRKIKSNLRPVFHRMFGQEGKYFYGLHFKRNKSLEKLEIIWQNFVENMEENNLFPIPEEYGKEEAEEYSNSKICFFVNLIAENDRLLTKYFENSRGSFFKQCIFYKWIQDEAWEKIAEYIAKSLMAFGDLNNIFDLYMDMISPFMDGYLMNEYTDYTDRWGRSIKIINKNNIEKFIDALCKASVMSIGCENHENYHKRVKEFVEKTTGDMSCFEKYGFSEKLDTRSGLERLKAFARDFLKSGKREIDFRVPPHELKSIHDKIIEENRALNYQRDIAYILACNDDIIEFCYKHTRRDFMDKGKMLAACIKHNDIERAIKIIELLKDTQAYENYNDLNGWERQFGLTIEYCIKEFDTDRFAWKQDEITPGMIEQCKEIAHMCFEYLSEESIDRIKVEIRRICPNEDGADEYIQKLLDDVKIYCTFPKPRGKGGAPNINRMSDEILNSFEILSNMGRIDVICQIMEQFAAVKDILKPVAYDTWMSFMNREIKDEDCIKIFRESRMVYEVWLGANTRERDIKEVARKINKYGTNEEYEEFKRLVISRCGKIEGIDEYCESNNWE